MPVTNVTVKKRLVLLLLITCIAYSALILRLAWLQLLKGEELQKKALHQWTKEIPVEPKRGTIYDRKGRELAISASVDTVIAYPPEIENPEAAAEALSKILDMDEETILELITKERASVYLKRKIDSEKSKEIRKLGIKGIGFTEESKRYYPDRNLAAHVLGFVGIDSQGLAGIEYYYDKYLRGYPGRIVSETDALSRELPFGAQHFVPPKDGLNLVLTIDKTIQHFAERELEKAMNRHRAKKGTVLVMDPRTGEILALVNKPDFDPNNYNDYPEESWKNIAISDVYEPGSTFKVITASAALEEKVVTPSTRYYDKGYTIVSGVRIGCWRHGGHGSQTFTQVVQNSCNPGFVDVAMKLGKEKFVNYINAFGFGQTSGIDFPGEGKGIFNPEKIGPVELATLSFGQGISVTPLQLLTAMSAIANDGKLMQPYIAKQLVDDNGNIIHEFKPRVVRYVISESTSKEMIQILESVVTNGTGGNAYLEGYRVAGKTGTAEKYIDGKYVSSFIGFAPADDPQVAILVILDEPQGIYYGGQTAAPVFRQVMLDTLRYLGVTPQKQEDESDKIKVPNVINLYIQEACSVLIKKGLEYNIKGTGLIVAEQFPAPGTIVARGETVELLLIEGKTDKSPAVVPDLTGKTIREAGEILDIVGLKIQAVGNGLAIDQEPKPGTKAELNTTVKVYFQQRN
ncbi:Stage V sporulation protein D [Koleobacter methoxysyntrophicus]|uniref:Stage V sporulation protein D n=1 Tax=Koleobacter methoxysyntrophicus TaxID=2751313 RepID=A0A8A0RMV2_9FIRM|nr:stage V sporulation protein D [Koleobacter methoxysyntrophicus]MDK2901926.1 hypothetical protein [Thermosediminibacterales bacterium]NPV44969.1 stage V sporulation protein D [Bacillota bacterium]QSQ09731.1 Stage V sporulation protein D [Koleobacter methoxysyntrophicus]